MKVFTFGLVVYWLSWGFVTQERMEERNHKPPTHYQHTHTWLENNIRVSRVHCGSAFGLCASGLPYYFAPLVCVVNGLGGLAVWWLYKQAKKQFESGHGVTITRHSGEGRMAFRALSRPCWSASSRAGTRTIRRAATATREGLETTPEAVFWPLPPSLDKTFWDLLYAPLMDSMRSWTGLYENSQCLLASLHPTGTTGKLPM